MKLSLEQKPDAPTEPTFRRGRPAFPRGQIVNKAIDYVIEHADEYLEVGQLASAVGVSERTLRAVFNKQFGMAPLQYLKLRRLNQIYQSLKDAFYPGTTVTETATRFGVWELGRFARDYRLKFGEYPSATLRQPKLSVPASAARLVRREVT